MVVVVMTEPQKGGQPLVSQAVVWEPFLPGRREAPKSQDKDVYRRNSLNHYKKPRQSHKAPSKVRKAVSNCWGQGYVELSTDCCGSPSFRSVVLSARAGFSLSQDSDPQINPLADQTSLDDVGSSLVFYLGWTWIAYVPLAAVPCEKEGPTPSHQGVQGLPGPVAAWLLGRSPVAHSYLFKK